MSEEKEFDWEKVNWEEIVKDPAQREAIPKEQLFKKIGNLQKNQKMLPRWGYFKLFVNLIYILFYITIGSWFVLNRTPYALLLIIIIVGNIYLFIDYFVLIYKTMRKQQ